MADDATVLLEPSPAAAGAARPAGGLLLASEFLLAAVGAALILLATSADQAWFERHSLPHMFLSQGEQTLLWQAGRGVALIIGLVIIGPARHWVAKRLGEGRARELALQILLVGLAVPLSLAVSELVLRTASWRGVDRWAAGEEPLRRIDRTLGWTNRPGRTGWEQFDGRRILYHIDHGGYRVGDPGRPVDPRRPSILFTGESIMLGFRLNWGETIAGRIEAATGLQSANLAVNGYATDQAYLRLAAALPRFARPVAVVALFAPSLIERNLDDDRPHLDTALRWHDGRQVWRLERVTKSLAIYHRATTIDSAIAATRAALEATVRRARERGAAAVILVPEFAPEQAGEVAIRRRVLDEAGLPYVRVMLDPAWRLAGDGHPDARADRAMADAVLLALRRQRPSLAAMPATR